MPPQQDAWPEQFKALLKDLARVLGEGAADFLQTPIYFRKDRRPHLVLGPAKQEEAYVEACLVKSTVFASLFDLKQPLWFVFTEEMFKGETGPHGPYPPEAPSIWDQPGLLPPELKDRAELRAFEKIDPYLLQGPAYRQWILFVKAEEIGIEKLHRASARWGRHFAGKKLKARSFCLQPGVPAIALNNELEGAMVLLAEHSGGLRPYARLFREWLKEGSPDLMELPKAALPGLDAERPQQAQQKARRNISALRDKNLPRVAEPSAVTQGGVNLAFWADRGYGLALQAVSKVSPWAEESVEDYLKRVVDQVRALRQEYSYNPDDEEAAACREALDESIWAIYDAWA